jgi:Holliday junction DNA helicase RuvA
MIGRLTGAVLAQEGDGVVLGVGGVGYELTVPMGTLGRIRPDETGRVTLWVHTHVREDVFALYGFADDAERTAFRALLGVSNVGPKIAVALLGALPAADLARAVATRNLGALTAVSGIGKKIAERILLELRDKLDALPAATAAAPGGAEAGAQRATHGDERLRSTLTAMGFRASEAERAVQAVAARSGAPFQELLREALAVLAR